MNYCIKRVNSLEYYEDNKEKPKIPRPPNAFMLYANENRKKMSQLYPTESNKDISKRLGNGWKALNEEERKKFFERAKTIGLQHKKEYPDYVYNPKEARIRKAMRDATRERSIGTSPMLPRPNARRVPQSWVPPHEDLMMPPMTSMRAGMENPVCGFSLASTGNNQFMGPMNGYSKLEPPPMSSTGSVHTNYMQSNPLAQLQQHTEMWPDYQAMRPRSSGKSPDLNNSPTSGYTLPPTNPYMMGEVPQYQPQSPEISNQAMMMEKPEIPSVNPVNGTPETNENITSNETENPDPQEHFMPVFEQNDMDAKMKKNEKVLYLPLSSQTFRASPDLLSNDLNYQNNYIMEYFQNVPSMTLMRVTTPSGINFPYATYVPLNIIDSINNELQVFENVSEPSFFNTDVGFVPMSTL